MLRNGKENGKTGKETGKSKQELAKAELLRLLLSCAEKCYGRRDDATWRQKIDELEGRSVRQRFRFFSQAVRASPPAPQHRKGFR